MCRFLLVKSKKPIKPFTFLKSFSAMAKNSKSYDGDWQGDGWGLTWLEDKKWKIYKSLLPVWEEDHKFPDFPNTTIFAVHARSSSFPQHKNNLEYNQPFINGKNLFIFNGLLKGVVLPFKIPGKIGAQKIWFLLKKELAKNPPEKALKNVKKLLLNHSKEVQAINIGLADSRQIYTLNYFTKYPDYYRLHYYKNEDLKFICSERLVGF